jgi:hypothetical protein
MFINRLIWKIGGWFRVVAGHGSSIAIKHKSIISTRPLRARARRPCIPSVCTSSYRRAHTRSPAARTRASARALIRAADRSGIFPLDWNLIKLKICQFRKKHPTAYIDGGHYTRWPTRQNSLA